MRSRLFILSLAVGLLGVAGCGSSSSSSSTSTTGSTGATTTPGKGHSASGNATVPNRTYSVKLTGAAETPAGAPTGSGTAVVTLNGKKLQACWTFKNVTGFDTPATAAHIHQGGKGASGPIVIAFGGAYTPKGCAPASAALITAIAAKPKDYYVNVHSKKYPGGAVRSQL